jgi:hypothetical protein
VDNRAYCLLPCIRTTLGVRINLCGVPGRSCWGDGDTQDFILKNVDIVFVDTATDFCEFTNAGVVAVTTTPTLIPKPNAFWKRCKRQNRVF